MLRSFFNVRTEDGGKRIYPPRYFDKLFDLEAPEEMEKIKEARRAAADARKECKLKNTSLSYLELLQVEERNKRDALKKLKRSL